MQDRYKILSNFIYNEMGLTKDEVRQWIKETIEQTAKTEFHRVMQSVQVEKMLKDASMVVVKEMIVSNHTSGAAEFRRLMAERVWTLVKDQIEIKVKLPTEE